MDILKKINQEKEEFESQAIEVVPGLSFNQKNLIETIYFYYSSKFKSGEIDVDGDRKYFFNIVKNPCAIYTKAIDFDTKHINILTAGGGNLLKTWYFERDLKFWMKDKQFGKVLNRIFKELPIFGSVVLKIVNNKPYFVDLRNFIVEKSADFLIQAGYIIEKHLYTPDEFRKIGKEMKWEKIEETLEQFRQMKNKYHICVYERYGEVEEEDEQGNKSYPFKRTFIADVGIDKFNNLMKQVVPYAGVVLAEDEADSIPYWEFHLDKLPGRWLGIGVVETLIEPQIRQNEVANLLSKSSYWNALRLFQTPDETVNKNLKSDVKDGEVLNPQSPITQIDISERNLAYFNAEYLKWMKNRDELTFSYDVIQGERLPAGTPLGSARLAAAMTMSHFDQIRENIALDIKEMLYQVVLPQFEKESFQEHTLRLVGEDIGTYREMLVNQTALNDLVAKIAKDKRIPDLLSFDLIKTLAREKIKQGKEILLTIPKNFYKGIKYAMDIVITGESKDTAIYAATLFSALQAITADPTILVDENKRKFFYKYLEAGGVNPNDFITQEKTELTDIMQMMPTKGAGGGVSAPRPVTPMMGEGTRVI